MDTTERAYLRRLMGLDSQLRRTRRGRGRGPGSRPALLFLSPHLQELPGSTDSLFRIALRGKNSDGQLPDTAMAAANKAAVLDNCQEGGIREARQQCR